MTYELYAPSVLLYFAYGLAFVFLGLAIAVKDMSASELRLADSLPSLAIFGFSHGLHEWLVCFQLLHAGMPIPLPVHYLTFLTLVVSFLFLNHFGISLLRSQPKIRWQWLRVLIPFLLLIVAMYIWLIGAHLDLQALRRADLLTRRTIALLGAGLAAFALLRHAAILRSMNREVAQNLRLASAGFGAYAVFAGLMPSHYSLPVLGVPVELLRSGSAMWITFFMVKALNIFHVETRKKLELHLRRLSQSEKLAALGKLAAGIAHEINNPLTNISLNVEMLRKDLESGLSSPDLEKRLRAIERNLARASGIASELLGFSRQQETGLQPVDINALILSTLTLLGSRRDEYRIETALQPVPPVMALPVKVEEVLLNVLSNAMEASEPGDRIEVRSRSQGANVLVEISDQGSGIAAEHLDHVMEPFYTTKEMGQGTGLGLSISYSIMEMLGGRIELASTAGTGTTVLLIFPAAEGAQHA
jgi:signal transduction histidine kinase